MGSELGNALQLLPWYCSNRRPLVTNCTVMLDCGLLRVIVEEKTESPSAGPCLHSCPFLLRGSQGQSLEQHWLLKAESLTDIEIWCLV